MGKTMAKFFKDNGLDGIDTEYQHLQAMNWSDGAVAEKWGTTVFTQTFRKTLSRGHQYVLTHVPCVFVCGVPNARLTADSTMCSSTTRICTVTALGCS